MEKFSSYSEMKKQNPEVYSVVKRMGSSRFFDPALGGLNPLGLRIRENPYFMTEEQTKTMFQRILSYDNLKEKGLFEILESWSYGQKKIMVGKDIYYIPDGNIYGWMQGMFMGMDAKGSINT